MRSGSVEQPAWSPSNPARAVPPAPAPRGRPKADELNDSYPSPPPLTIQPAPGESVKSDNVSMLEPSPPPLVKTEPMDEMRKWPSRPDSARESPAHSVKTLGDRMSLDAPAIEDATSKLGHVRRDSKQGEDNMKRGTPPMDLANGGGTRKSQDRMSADMEPMKGGANASDTPSSWTGVRDGNVLPTKPAASTHSGALPPPERDPLRVSLISGNPSQYPGDAVGSGGNSRSPHPSNHWERGREPPRRYSLDSRPGNGEPYRSGPPEPPSAGPRGEWNRNEGDRFRPPPPAQPERYREPPQAPRMDYAAYNRTRPRSPEPPRSAAYDRPDRPGYVPQQPMMREYGPRGGGGGGQYVDDGRGLKRPRDRESYGEVERNRMPPPPGWQRDREGDGRGRGGYDRRSPPLPPPGGRGEMDRGREPVYRGEGGRGGGFGGDGPGWGPPHDQRGRGEYRRY